MAREKVDLAVRVKELKFYPLSKGFRMAKPIKRENYDESVIYDLEKAGRLIITRKRNGWKLYAVKDETGVWRLYTDGCREVHFLEHIKTSLAGHSDIPCKTILVGEAISQDMSGFDKLERIQSIFMSKDPSAKMREVGEVSYRLFEIAVWGGEPACAEFDYVYRLSLLREKFGADKGLTGVAGRVATVEYHLASTYDEAKRIAVAKKWEGLVLYDDLFRSSFRLDGKDPERITGCFKWKPVWEDDFIVRHPIMDPKDPNRVKEVALSQFNGVYRNQGPKEFDCGVFGNFDKKTREWLRRAKYPLVIHLEFDYRFESGKLQAARFVRFRYDKNIRDCRAPRKYPVE